MSPPGLGEAGRRTLAANLAAVRERIARAAGAAGRAADEIVLIAVTKYVDADTVAALLELGVTDLGESRPQRLWELAPDFPHARWHLIGHWQTNKIRRTLPLLSACHSVDSYKLAAEISREAARADRVLPCFLEAHVAASPRKGGFAPADLPAALPALAALPNLSWLGLMAMADAEEVPDAARPTFRAARELAAALHAAEPRFGTRLSMGMSGDFEAAIAEGATHVRVGSLLFEGLAR